MEGESGKGQHQPWTDTERAHCPLCPVPCLKQRAHVITHDCPVSLVCAVIRIPRHPTLSCRRLQADPALCPPQLGLLPPPPSVLCHRPDTWGYGQSPRFSHVIPGTLWHVDRGADTGREEAGRAGIGVFELLVLGQHGEAVGAADVTMSRMSCRVVGWGDSQALAQERACPSVFPRGALGALRWPTQWPSVQCGRSAAYIALRPGCRSQPASSGSHCTASCSDQTPACCE